MKREREWWLWWLAGGVWGTLVGWDGDNRGSDGRQSPSKAAQEVTEQGGGRGLDNSGVGGYRRPVWWTTDRLSAVGQHTDDQAGVREAERNG